MRRMEEDEKKRAERRSAMKSAMTGYDEVEAREALAISSNEPGVA